ncbi:MAG: hypothetical protein HYV63_00935 [Candidatus Schekmanbacteria bacterium]|nr:hypothetical protein [Candidatus Schekmanbacteria bacterium]
MSSEGRTAVTANGEPTAHSSSVALCAASDADGAAGVVLPLEAVEESAGDLVGSKALHLAMVSRCCGIVPRGIVVTTRAVLRFVAANSLDSALGSLCTGAHMTSDPRRAAEEAHRLFRDGRFPEALRSELLALVTLTFGDGSVAVRSSFSSEDSHTQSGAGSHESFLQVHGEHRLIEAIKDCWASQFSERALAYQSRNGATALPPPGAVLIQRMVCSRVSGVLFTRDPCDPSSANLLVDATYGLGLGTVSGNFPVDSFTVNRRSGKVMAARIRTKHHMVCAAEVGTAIRPVPPELQSVASLTESELGRLAKIGLELETSLGFPLDVEWAIEADTIYVLQARPITPAASHTRTGGDTWVRRPFLEIFPDPLTPLTGSLLERELNAITSRFWHETLGVPDADLGDVLRAFHHRAYLNLSFMKRLSQRYFPGMYELLREFLSGLSREDQKAWRLVCAIRPRISMIRPTLKALAVVLRAGRRWERESAEFFAAIAAWRARALSELSDDELKAGFSEVSDLSFHVFGANLTTAVAAGLHYLCLQQVLAFAAADRQGHLCENLVVGLPGNKTLEGNLAIWTLYQHVHASATLRRLFASPVTAERVLDELAGSADGRRFREALDGFLAAFGVRATSEQELSLPRIRENPQYVVETIRRYLLAEPRDLPTVLTELERRKVESDRQVRARLTSGWLRYLVSPLTRTLYCRARRGVERLMPLRENTRFAFLHALDCWRRLSLEIGDRLVARAVLARRDEVFFLTLEEAFRFLRRGRPANLDELLRARREQLQAASAQDPPASVGPPPDFDTPHRTSRSSRVVGVGVSPGRATGVARVLYSPADIGRLGRGEIIVAPSVSASWTPLFPLAEAVVTELGNALSHGAILAREYGIPFVANIHDATRVIADGSRIVVDGDAGTIEAAPSPPS